MSITPITTILRIVDKTIFALTPSLQILATAAFIDTVIQIFNGYAQRSQLMLPLVFMTLLTAYYFLSDILFSLARSVMGIKLNQVFRPAVAQKRAALEYRHIENNDTWELISRVGKDPGRKVEEGFGSILELGIIIINTASIFVVIATQVWWAALAIIAISVPLFVIALKSGKQMYNAFVEAQKHTRRAEYIQQVLTSRESVEERALFKYSDELNKRWYERFLASFEITRKVSALVSIRQRVGSLVVVLISVLIAGVLVFPLINGDVSIGMFIGMVNAAFLLVRTMSFQLTGMTTGLAHSNEYLKDLSAFSQLSETPGAADDPADIMPAPKCIEFRNISFAYPETENMILKNLSMKLLVGKHYAFVGANGAGKTTLTKLLTGLYDNYTGDILIDDKNLREFSQAELKALFSVVYQDFATYQIPFKDSVGVSNASATDGELAAAVNLVELDDVIAKLPQGVDTPLGKIQEGGVDLSGGEWQRVAIARSILSKAPVRILDEPTAALDPVAESAVYEMFGEISKGKSTVFITHRLGAAKLADEIFVISDGHVAESGSHDRLMAQDGLYAKMFESQRGWYADEY